MAIRFNVPANKVVVGNLITDGYIGRGIVTSIQTHPEYESLFIFEYNNGMRTVLSKNAVIYSVTG